jgi:hypothetical protein
LLPPKWRAPVAAERAPHDKAAPVIVEELASFGPTSLKGQLGLWSHDSVQRAMRAKK